MSTASINPNLYCPCCGETPGDHNQDDCAFTFKHGQWLLPNERTSEFVRYSDPGCMNDMRFGSYDD